MFRYMYGQLLSKVPNQSGKYLMYYYRWRFMWTVACANHIRIWLSVGRSQVYVTILYKLPYDDCLCQFRCTKTVHHRRKVAVTIPDIGPTPGSPSGYSNLLSTREPLQCYNPIVDCQGLLTQVRRPAKSSLQQDHYLNWSTKHL